MSEICSHRILAIRMPVSAHYYVPFEDCTEGPNAFGHSKTGPVPVFGIRMAKLQSCLCYPLNNLYLHLESSSLFR